MPRQMWVVMVMSAGLERAVDGLHVALGHGVEVDALGLIGRALVGVAELAPAGVVELQVAAALVVEGLDGVLVGLGDVVRETVLALRARVALDRAVGHLAAHAGNEVQHGGRGDGQLCGVAARNLLETAEVLDERVIRPKVDLAREAQLRALGLGALELHGPGVGRDLLHAVECGEKVQVPHGATELAVGDGAQAGGLLLLHELGDALVLDSRELGFVDLSGRVLGAGILQALRPEEASNDVVGVGRLLKRGGGHGCSLSRGMVANLFSIHDGRRARHESVSIFYRVP